MGGVRLRFPPSSSATRRLESALSLGHLLKSRIGEVPSSDGIKKEDFVEIKLQNWRASHLSRRKYGELLWQPHPPRVSLLRQAFKDLASRGTDPSKIHIWGEGLFSLQGEALVIDGLQVTLARQHGLITGLPTLHPDAIADKARADGLVKLLAFLQDENRDFGLFTESYGGHYELEFASYFESQNAAITSGSVSGQKIDLMALGTNSGQLITLSQYKSYISAYNSKCVPALAKCTSQTGSNSACGTADSTWDNAVEAPIENANDFDVYDSAAVVKAIGAKSTYAECPNAPYEKFANTGDGARSFLSSLSTVVQSGIQVLIWAGDADWICNWMGGIVAAMLIAATGRTAWHDYDRVGRD
ncbi:Alpha/Beta hydrolase protein [Lasiosphaeria ovina]|uniref:Alpha/Beta hydrolase protein n=1 Tax=Lasiosphaeria ovina TaxID=92902 RepID=A0AAE0K3K0_9PEZI|nr:Alpha/Beta hydrolase protein [Lasiosphaeria ovina]